MSTLAPTSPVEPPSRSGHSPATIAGIVQLLNTLHGISDDSSQSKASGSQKKGKESLYSPRKGDLSASPFCISASLLQRAVDAFPVHEGKWYTECLEAQQKNNRGDSSSSGYGLSPGSTQTLMCLHSLVRVLFKADVSPTERFQLLILVDTGMGPDHALRTRTEARFSQAVDELDEASIELLPPELRDIKRGWDQMTKKPQFELRHVERRINELLRADGEEELKLPSINDRMDRSLRIPTRVPKTKAELQEQSNIFRDRTKDLIKRKPELWAAITQVTKNYVAKTSAATNKDKGRNTAETEVQSQDASAQL